jgi:hypothetical protein
MGSKPSRKESLHKIGVEQGRGQELNKQGRLGFSQARLQRDLPFFNDAPHQAEAVAVHSAAGYAHNPIPDLHLPPIDEAIFIHYPNAKSSKVVLTRRIEARHLCRFPPEKGAAADAATLGDAFNDVGEGLRCEPACSDVIQEKKRFGATGNDVIRAHGHQVNADAVVTLQALGEFQLCAHPIAASHQEGPTEPLGQTTQSSEASHPAENFWPAGGVHAAANAIDEGPASHHIHACAAVIHGFSSTVSIFQWHEPSPP